MKGENDIVINDSALKQGVMREQLNITPEQFQEMGRIGVMFYEQGHLEKARSVFEALVRLDPNSADAHSALGALYTRLKRDDEALEHLSRAVELDVERIAPYVNRAEVYIRKMDIEKAVADLRRAVELDPEEKDPGANRARAIALGIHEAFEAKGIM
jgi:Flp pilus assembly protein TadD